MLSFEVKNAEASRPPDELEIFVDREGLDALLAQLQLLKSGRTGHVHLMSVAWGGTHLDNHSHGRTNTTIHHVKIHLR